jgi:hypothetical protein
MEAAIGKVENDLRGPRLPSRPTDLGDSTALARALAWVMAVPFLMLTIVPATAQWIAQPSEQNNRMLALLRALPTFPAPQALVNWADDLARDSVVGSLVRRYYQLALTAGLREGSAKVAVGRDHWLFLREDLNLSAGTAILNERLDPSKRKPEPENPDSVAVIRAYDSLLRARGIHLVVLPVPSASALYPEKVWQGYPAEAGPAWAPDYAAWKDKLRRGGVDVLDVTEELWRERNGAEPVWLQNNTHWSPRGVELTADAIARHIRPLLGSYTARTYQARAVDHLAESDLAPMLDLPRSDLYPPVPCKVRQVLEDGRFASGSDDSRVLLLGDSYSFIYSGRDPEDAQGADLGRQIMFRLGTDVQVIAYRGDDPTRLRWRLGFHGPCLDAKKVVIWEFTTRYLHDPVTWKYWPIPPVGGWTGRAADTSTPDR